MKNAKQHEETQNLPKHFNLLQFASTRAKEIDEIKQSLQSTSGTKMAFQRLPKHMRRRVMSHNVKRLPKCLHQVHLNQLKKSGMPPKQKHHSRKYRRRPNNLLNDYSRRQKKHVWLETHLWHAKRFHMVNKWGHRLADRPCDKSFRSCYRATSNHCLAQDLSYFSCIEIQGPIEAIVNTFKTISESNSGLNINAAAYIRGNREGQTVLFSTTDGVRQAVGSVYFHWKPVFAYECELVRVLWLWVHPAYYLEVEKLLQDSFTIKEKTDTNSQIRIVELKNDLNRFRLTGPLSFPVLYNVLKIANSNNVNSKWFSEYLLNPINSQIYLSQSEYWNNLQGISSAAELSPHHVLSLTVVDPRYNISRTKQKATLPLPKTTNYLELPKYAAVGQIWDFHCRNKVKNDKISNADIAKLRSELLVPDIDKLGAGEAIPVLIIQRPGNRSCNIGYGSGWDIIVPSGWGNTFWVSLIMWGARAGGLQEFKSIDFECGRPNFLAPDTKAGMDDEQEWSKTYKERYFSLPSNKRPNYIKLGITEPFNCNWKALIREWNLSEISTFYVLRDKKCLQSMQEMIQRKSRNFDNSHFNANCIIPIKIKLDSKGVVNKFARICLPCSKDLVAKTNTLEPLQFDNLRNSRKEMKIAHRNLLHQLRQRRKTNRGFKTAIDRKILLDYNKKMQELWLPERTQNTRSMASRELIGFVTMGGFSFMQACCCAVGYITMGAMKVLLSSDLKNKVLIRNINSRQYRLGSIEITM